MKFDADFREGAVRLVRRIAKPIEQVARELGINEGTPGSWVNTGKRRHGEGNGARWMRMGGRARAARARERRDGDAA